MNRIVTHGARTGEMKVPSSKSQAHRLLICAALSEQLSVIRCDGISKDIEATINCLNALGADIRMDGTENISVRPLAVNGAETLKSTVLTAGSENAEKPESQDRPAAGNSDPQPGKDTVHLYCKESGSTLRFLIPVAGALGKTAVFHMEGRLPERPVDELMKTCTENGMTFRKDGSELFVSGKLRAGMYTVDGRISSQYITGLLFALPMLDGSSTLRITGGLESSAYIRMTEDALSKSGISFVKEENEYRFDGRQGYHSPQEISVECDWSGAAFPLCMGAFSNAGITVRGLDPGSVQGDKKILEILSEFGAEIHADARCITVKKGKLRGITVDAAEIPDLIPVICAVAAAADGETCITNAGRLRLKESDRIKTTAEMIASLGGDARETKDGLIIRGKPVLSGGLVNSYGDHRIAMSAAAAAAVCTGDVTITDPECTGKSYPGFFERMNDLASEPVF